MPLIPASQNKRRSLIRTAMMFLSVLFVVFALSARIWDAPVHAPMLAVLVVFCVLALLEFSVFDEFAKLSHYSAWYWGSLLGLIGVAAVSVLFSLESHPLGPLQDAIIHYFGPGGDTKADAFVAGTVTTPLLMALGFFVVRGVTWYRNR
jgi:hypothetical protein